MSEGHIHICRAPFGLGSYKYVDEDGKEQWGYGIWNPQNPNDFFPDPECATAEEIKAWKKAKRDWNKAHKVKK